VRLSRYHSGARPSFPSAQSLFPLAARFFDLFELLSDMALSTTTLYIDKPSCDGVTWDTTGGIVGEISSLLSRGLRHVPQRIPSIGW